MSSPKAGLQRKLPATPNSFTKITRIPLKPPQLARELSSDGSDVGARRRRRPRKEFKCLPVMTPFFFYPVSTPRGLDRISSVRYIPPAPQPALIWSRLRLALRSD
ncbi:hypothetical protein HGRIS_011174 [Hohenbuehelia grisea]|uniref:Uncharacterized protein n=1 Tax=Hohenbuehelia grisea TaxID=104357 RepID=A0ABR3JUE8_9AGAR